MSNATVQMRALVNGHVMEGPISAKRGDPRNVFWTTPERAQHYIVNKMAEPIVDKPVYAPVAGPSQTKPIEASIKKSLPDSQLGLSTDSAKSDMSGEGSQSSAAPAETVSPKGKPNLLERGKNALKRRGR